MLFGGKIVNSDNLFSQFDLIQYVESLVREARVAERLEESKHYAWLSSKHVHCGLPLDLDALRPLISKMSPESCVAIAVELDKVTAILNAAAILSTFKKLLLERHNLQMLEATVSSRKEMKKRKRLNKVQPELLPAGRQATVSFIVEIKY